MWGGRRGVRGGGRWEGRGEGGEFGAEGVAGSVVQKGRPGGPVYECGSEAGRCGGYRRGRGVV